MASQYEEMHYEQNPNRSPGTNGLPPRYNTINRQPSRHFDGYGQPSALYTADDYASQFNVQTTRLPPPIYSNSYESGTWNYNAANANAATMGASRMRTPARRAPIPNNWVPEPAIPPYSPMPGVGMNGFPNGFPNGQHLQHIQQTPSLHRSEVTPTSDDGEELIPTAIVIKNIPFAVKKEQLQNLMQDIGLPVPYAFNYHFDNGVFRGLAFANFQNPEDTKVVIETMNHMELQGRKLRVEYKKMLPLQERERIEREKRERRGQLEEQHRPVNGLGLHNQASMSSLNSALPATSPSPVSMRMGQTQTSHPTMRDVNMNDPQTLEFYGKLLVFKDDPNRKVMVFPAPISPAHRKILHSLSHHLGLHHQAVGSGESRHLQIFKEKPANMTTDLQSPNYSYTDSSRRGLNRAATIDFSESGVRETGHYHTLRSQNSSLLDIPGSPGGLGIQRGQSLREAKSFGDLQSRRASPALSSSSFPANLTQNVTRYTEYGAINGGPTNTEMLPPGSSHLINGRDDAFFNGSFANLSLGFDRPAGARDNGRLGMNGDSRAVGGAIGSQRSHTGLSGNFEDMSRNGTASVPERQPRGPGSEWGSGFTRPRQNGHPQRGSDELDLNDLDQSSDRTGTNSRYM